MTGPSEDAAREPARPDCLCGGVGPEVTRLLRQLGSCDDLWQQVRAAETEVLKLLRALIDARLADADRGRTPPTKGTRVAVD